MPEMEKEIDHKIRTRMPSIDLNTLLETKKYNKFQAVMRKPFHIFDRRERMTLKQVKEHMDWIKEDYHDVIRQEVRKKPDQADKTIKAVVSEIKREHEHALAVMQNEFEQDPNKYPLGTVLDTSSVTIHQKTHLKEGQESKIHLKPTFKYKHAFLVTPEGVKSFMKFK